MYENDWFWDSVFLDTNELQQKDRNEEIKRFKYTFRTAVPKYSHTLCDPLEVLSSHCPFLLRTRHQECLGINTSKLPQKDSLYWQTEIVNPTLSFRNTPVCDYCRHFLCIIMYRSQQYFSIVGRTVNDHSKFSRQLLCKSNCTGEPSLCRNEIMMAVDSFWRLCTFLQETGYWADNLSKLNMNSTLLTQPQSRIGLVRRSYVLFPCRYPWPSAGDPILEPPVFRRRFSGDCSLW